MSTIQLSAFVSYRKTQTVLEHSGEISASRLLDSGKYEVTIKSAGLPVPSVGLSMARPERMAEGMLLLYGRDRLHLLHQANIKARAAGLGFASSEFEFEVGNIESGLLDMDALPGLRFGSVRRMKADLQMHLLTKFAEYVSEEGGDADAEMSKPIHMALRPDLFGRVMKDDPALAGLDVLAIPVADTSAEPVVLRQFAYVRPTAQLVGVRHLGEVNVVLPDWMNRPARREMH